MDSSNIMIFDEHGIIEADEEIIQPLTDSFEVSIQRTYFSDTAKTK